MKKETLKISEPGEKLFDFNVPEDANDHFFMSEELPTPNVNKCDTQRLNMFSNHINQAVHLVESDFPKVSNVSSFDRNNGISSSLNVMVLLRAARCFIPFRC